MLTRAAPAKVDPSWDARISKLRTRQREARRIDPVTTTVTYFLHLGTLLKKVPIA
jgi:hypothetical protein